MMKKLLSAIFVLVSAALWADTMWLVTPDFSYSRRMLTQYCGDAPAAAEYRHAPSPGSFGAIRVGNKAFLNSRGVCVVAQEMPSHLDRENHRATLDVEALAARVAFRSPDAPAAVRGIMLAVKKRNFRGGAVFLVSDPRRAFAVECSPNRFDADEVQAGFCVYSHTWRLPALCSVLHLDLETLWFQKARETMLARKLAERMESQGVSLGESAALARLDEVFGVHKVHLGPFGEKSQCSVVFEADDEFPEAMSAVYVALGSPRHSPHLPVAFCNAARAEFPDAAWLDRAEKLRKTAGDDPEFAAALRDLESKLFEDFRRTRMTARHKLRRDGRREAFKMLAELQHRQAAECRRFMDEQMRKYSSRQAEVKK